MPRHGFKRAQAEREKNWVIEVPQNADPFEDQFEKLEKKKQEKVLNSILICCYNKLLLKILKI